VSDWICNFTLSVLRPAYFVHGSTEMLCDVELVEDDPSIRVGDVFAG